MRNTGDLHLGADAVALVALGEPVAATDRRHLDTCRFCQAQVADLASVVAVGRAAEHEPPQTSPPPEVWELLRGALMRPASHETPARSGSEPAGGDASTESATVTPLRRRSKPSRTRSTLFPLLAAAVVGLMVGAGLVALLGSWQSTPEVLASAPLGPVPDGPDGAQRGFAEVALVDGVEMLSVTTENLSDPQGFYEVWLLNLDTGGMIAMGTVPAGVQRTLLPVPIGVDIGEYRLVDISDEPFDGNPGHSSVSVLRGDLTT